MTKKRVSQNNSETTEKEENDLTKLDDTCENSNNSEEINNTDNSIQKTDFLFLTPLKRIKLNIPMAPKKKRKILEVNNYNIRGKNLLNLFKLVA